MSLPIRCLLVAVMVAPSRLAAQIPADTAALIDQVFASFNRSDAPGCSMGMDRNGTPVFRRSYGMASLESGAPMTGFSVAELAALAGPYYSQELDVSYLITPSEGGLTVKFGERAPITLRPNAKDSFAGPMGLGLKFTRAATGRADGFVLGAGRVNNLRFVRR